MSNLVLILLAIAIVCGHGPAASEAARVYNEAVGDYLETARVDNEAARVYNEVPDVEHDDTTTNEFLENAIQHVTAHLNEDDEGNHMSSFLFKFFQVHESINNENNPIQIRLANVVFKETRCKRNDDDADLNQCDFMTDGKEQTCHISLLYLKGLDKLHKIIFVCHPFNVIYDIIKLISNKDDSDSIYKLYRIHSKDRRGYEETMIISLKETECPKGPTFPESLYNCEIKKDAKHKFCHVRVLHDTRNYPKEVYFICNDKYGMDSDEDIAAQQKDVSLIVNGTNHGVILYRGKHTEKVVYSDLDLACYVLKRNYFQPSRQEIFQFAKVNRESELKPGEKMFELSYKEGTCKTKHPRPSKTTDCVYSPNGREKLCNVTLLTIPNDQKAKATVSYVCRDVEPLNIAEVLKNETGQEIIANINHKLNLDGVPVFGIVETSTLDPQEEGVLKYKVQLQESTCPQNQDGVLTTPPITTPDCHFVEDGKTMSCIATLTLASKTCPSTLAYECKHDVQNSFLANKRLQEKVQAETQNLLSRYTRTNKYFKIGLTSEIVSHDTGEKQTSEYQSTTCDENVSTADGCTITKVVDPGTCEINLQLGVNKRPSVVTVSCPKLEKEEAEKKILDHIIEEILKDTNNKHSTKLLFQFSSQKSIGVKNNTRRIIVTRSVDLQETDCKREPKHPEYTPQDLDTCHLNPEGKRLRCIVHIMTTLRRRVEVEKSFRFFCRSERKVKINGTHVDPPELNDAVVIIFPKEVLLVPEAKVEINVEDFSFDEVVTDSLPWTRKCREDNKIVPNSGSKSTCDLVRPFESNTISEEFLFTCHAELVSVPCEAIIQINKMLQLDYFFKIEKVLDYRFLTKGRWYNITIIETSCKRADYPDHEIAYCPQVENGAKINCQVLVHNESSSLRPLVDFECNKDSPLTPTAHPPIPTDSPLIATAYPPIPTESTTGEPWTRIPTESTTGEPWTIIPTETTAAEPETITPETSPYPTYTFPPVPTFPTAPTFPPFPTFPTAPTFPTFPTEPTETTTEECEESTADQPEPITPETLPYPTDTSTFPPETTTYFPQTIITENPPYPEPPETTTYFPQTIITEPSKPQPIEQPELDLILKQILLQLKLKYRKNLFYRLHELFKAERTYLGEEKIHDHIIFQIKQTSCERKDVQSKGDAENCYFDRTGVVQLCEVKIDYQQGTNGYQEVPVSCEPIKTEYSIGPDDRLVESFVKNAIEDINKGKDLFAFKVAGIESGRRTVQFGVVDVFGLQIIETKCGKLQISPNCDVDYAVAEGRQCQITVSYNFEEKDSTLNYQCERKFADTPHLDVTFQEASRYVQFSLTQLRQQGKLSNDDELKSLHKGSREGDDVSLEFEVAPQICHKGAICNGQLCKALVSHNPNGGGEPLLKHAECTPIQ